MVFKTGSTKKGVTPKSAGKPKTQMFQFEDDDDCEMATDALVKSPGKITPRAKTTLIKQTPTGKQTPNKNSANKKVSFDLSVNKTPKGGENMIGKRQLTPASKGRQGVQGFKGMKSVLDNSKNKSSVKVEDDDDDIDEDDDDDDIDEDDDDDEDIDEDDDVDDEAVDEEDDDSDEDDNAADKDIPNSLQNKLQQLKQTEKKKSQQDKNVKQEVTSRTQYPKEENQKKNAMQIRPDTDRLRERDLRTLFIRNLPLDTTAAELKALSADILSVNLPHLSSNRYKRKKGVKYLIAFLEFSNEEKTEENMTILESKQFRGAPLIIDFCGEKSHSKVFQTGAQNMIPNKKKLYFSGIPLATTIDQIAKLCPKAVLVATSVSDMSRHATAAFLTEDDAAECFEANRSVEIAGKSITVLYALTKSSVKRKRHSDSSPQNAKRMKQSPNSGPENAMGKKQSPNSGPQNAKRMKQSPNSPQNAKRLGQSPNSGPQNAMKLGQSPNSGPQNAKKRKRSRNHGPRNANEGGKKGPFVKKD